VSALSGEADSGHLVFKDVAIYNGYGDPIDASRAEQIASAFRMRLPGMFIANKLLLHHGRGSMVLWGGSRSAEQLWLVHKTCGLALRRKRVMLPTTAVALCGQNMRLF